jgi:hypothetical protein
MTHTQDVPNYLDNYCGDKAFFAISIINDDEGKYYETIVDGWSCHNEPEDLKKGVTFVIDDNSEIIIPFAEIRKMAQLMDYLGV